MYDEFGVQVAEVPKGLVRAALVMAGNALFMACVEIIIEVLVLAGTHPTTQTMKRNLL
jgi:hypothetical protein